jgi:hypothetical protein
MKRLFMILLFPWAAFGFNDAPSCLYYLETQFFPHAIVQQSFDLFYIFQSQWGLILIDLDAEVKKVPQLVKDRAKSMKPNPLEHPFDPEKTKEILLAVEFEVFRSVMMHNSLGYKMEAIKGMFDYIVSRQEQRIDACLGKKKAQPGAKKY